ncbi:hypothetical protein A5780_07355 [Nocardia sp. 852002-20019_SCH5090214]|uniref:hypothetical protein n=1 Tax=Nocardia sp. 852002-20019_SCH5090214 TaxID=1834087 RepID=UPI0007EB0EBA|nr:hypothetical protein [Nocardia sp. 852002-20019_SCH5090214]OBA40388.1 hypothetical protein A5780_07355 [Nocardia sp. 852002-20019_SCH5090214]
MRKSTTAVLAATALALAAATANATPQPSHDNTAVRYEVTRQGDAAVVTISGGELRLATDQLVLIDRDQQPVAAIPLTYRIDNTAYPIAVRIDGATATLIPDKAGGQPVQAVTRDQIITTDQAATQIAESFTPRDAQALGVFAQRAAIAAAVSAVLGAVLGAGVGCLVGAAAGAAISSPVLALLVPFVGATIAGCVLGAATLGAVGSMIGLVVAGGPITLFSAIQYFSTILAPCPPDTAYCKDPAQAATPSR